MASTTKRSWRLQDFMAHNANVNCLSLGHKSGRVMVTGGDDKKVNLWAVGKESCFMSLTGHTTPIECVQFNQLEELVCAGSRAGALKVWDLEAAKLVRTLNGHKYTIKCTDFHPYGNLLVSGSADSSIKIWDTRKKGVLFTYNGHKGMINSIKFSPDGQWIASGGEDGLAKIWDLRVGRVLKEFTDHLSAVTCVEFHPHEFLLTTGSTDRSVHFFDLENFSLVSSECELGPVRNLCFNPDGECLFVGVRDYLKIIGWEPNRVFDTVPVNWGRVCDISTAQNQLVGASFHQTNVQVFVVDLKKCHPMGVPCDSPSGGSPLPPVGHPFASNQGVRKSFSKAERPVSLRISRMDAKSTTIEESTSGTDPEEESLADITNLKDYNEIFKGRDLSRTPPPEPEPFQEPERDYSDPSAPQVLGDESPVRDTFEALSLDDNLNRYQQLSSEPPLSPAGSYSRSKSNLEQVYASRSARQQAVADREMNSSQQQVLSGKQVMKPPPPVPPKFLLQRQSSVRDVPEKGPTKPVNMKHSQSEANINKSNNTSSRSSSRKNSFSKPSRNSSVPNVSRMSNINNSSKISEKPQLRPMSIMNSVPVDIYVSTKLSPDKSPVEEDEFIPTSLDRPVGLDLDDFLPKNHTGLGRFQQQQPDMSEAEVMGVLLRGHGPTMGILAARQRGLRVVMAQHRAAGIKGAVEAAVAMDDVTVLVDVLGVINSKYSRWSLDICVSVLPKILDLLQSKYEQYMTVGCNTLKLILRHFGPVIRTNVQSPVGSYGVDLSREERYRKAVKCHEMLSQLRSCVGKKASLPGTLGAGFREVTALMASNLD